MTEQKKDLVGLRGLVTQGAAAASSRNIEAAESLLDLDAIPVNPSTSDDADNLNRLQGVISSHLARFAQNEIPDLTWV